MPSIYRFENKGMRERLHIKSFKTMQALHEFLNKQTNNDWHDCVNPKIPTKSGVYAYAGGQWHNVKTLDSCILAHV